MTRRAFGVLFGAVGTFGLLYVLSGWTRTRAQERTPNRREFTVTIRDHRFTPEHIDVTQDDLVRLTVRSEDVAHSFVIDEYRIVKRVPAGGTTTFEFRADRAGTFPFYCNITSEAGHDAHRGQLVVRGA